MDKIIERLDSYIDRFVPKLGKADTQAGEILRALLKIGYRFYNDGDQIGVGYGNETCNPAARFLLNKLPDAQTATITDMWQNYGSDEKGYEARLLELIDKTLDWLDTTDLDKQPNEEDMLSYSSPEDKDYIREEEEEEYFYEDEYEDEEYENEEYDEDEEE